MVIKKDLNGAITHYHKAIEIDPKNAGAYNSLGLVLYANKDLAAAIHCFQQAL